MSLITITLSHGAQEFEFKGLILMQYSNRTGGYHLALNREGTFIDVTENSVGISDVPLKIHDQVRFFAFEDARTAFHAACRAGKFVTHETAYILPLVRSIGFPNWSCDFNVETWRRDRWEETHRKSIDQILEKLPLISRYGTIVGPKPMKQMELPLMVPLLNVVATTKLPPLPTPRKASA